MPTLLRINPLLVSLLHLLRAHARSTRPATPLAAEDACSGANGSLPAGDGPASLLASREFDACLRVSESAAVRCCEPAAVANNGLSSLATANWVLGIWYAACAHLWRMVRSCRSFVSTRSAPLGSANSSLSKGRRIVMHLARRRTQADLH